MPINRYPRHGYPLAPTALRTILAVPIPKNFLVDANCANLKLVQLCELDKNAWQTFSPEVCSKLGREIVDVVRAAISTTSKSDDPNCIFLTRARLDSLLETKLPSVPVGKQLEDLNLEQRTYNCLYKMQFDGLLGGPQDLARKSIRQVLAIESFGAKSLVDLLTSLEGEGAESSPPTVGQDTEPKITLGESNLEAVFIGRFRNLRLPSLPVGTKLSDLQLSRRTYNCLLKRGFNKRIAELSGLTLGEIFEIPGFGMQCLVDYLDAVDRHRRGETERRSKVKESSGLYAELELHQYLEDELRDLVQRSFGKKNPALALRNIEIVLAYYGCDGGGGATLQGVGEKFGITKERIRQICEKAVGRLKQLRSRPPRLHAVLESIGQNLPSDAETLEKLLQTQGFTRSVFKMEGLLLICKLLGNPPPFDIEDVEGRRMVVHPEKVRMTRRSIVQARKSVSQFGVATVLDLAAVLSEKLSTKITPEFVTRILVSQLGFEWLDNEAGWFWFRNLPKNRVVSRLRKILSVSEHIEVGELRTGIARHHAMNGYAPPRKVLLELCKRLPYCVVEGNNIRSDPPIEWKTALRGTELLMISVLKEHGPVLPRARFEQLCLGMGMKRSTFYAYLGYSPVIERYASSVYGIRGARIEPGVVESLIPNNQRTKGVRLDHGWTNDRRIWIGYCLSEGMVGNGAFSVPGPMKQFLQGKYVMKTTDGATVGNVVVKDNAGWGLGTLFRRRGGEPGDTLLLVFDAKAQVVLASIGDESLLEQFEVENSEGHVSPGQQRPSG